MADETRRVLLIGAMLPVMLEPFLRRNAAPWYGGADTTAVQISVFDYIPAREHDAIRRGDTTYDCTIAIQRAIAAVKGTGRTLAFPEGSYLVSTVTVDGSDYRMDTSQARFVQRRHVTGEVTAIIHIVSAARIRIGQLRVVGNIRDDTGESHHGVMLSKSRQVRIDGVFAEDVRGDALYCYARNTSDDERQSDCHVGRISGTNVYRNLLTVVGGQLHVGALVNAGPVGYRDFDVEPNRADGTYEAADLQIDIAEVGTCEVTSDDARVINRSVRIGRLDADLARVRPTVPPYPRAPGAGAYAIGISRIRSVRIDHFRARNYNGYPISLSYGWSELDIGMLDIARCSLRDSVYDTMILQQGDAEDGEVRIGTLICDAANTKYLARVHHKGFLKIDVDTVRMMNCLVGVQISGRFANGRIDLAGSSKVALVDSTEVVFEGITFLNGGAATGFSGCSNVRVVNSTLAFQRLDRGAPTRIVAINSSLNGTAMR